MQDVKSRHSSASELDDVEGHYAVRGIDFVELLFMRVIDVVVKYGVGSSSQHGLSYGFIVPCADEVRNAGFCGGCFACCSVA